MSTANNTPNVLDIIWELSQPTADEERDARVASQPASLCAAPTEEKEHVEEPNADPEARARRAALLARLGPELLAERDALHELFGIPRDAP